MDWIMPIDTDQMFLDHGPDSFLGEVIGIMNINELCIQILTPEEMATFASENPTIEISPHDKVVVTFRGKYNDTHFDYIHGFACVTVGRSYGECLRRIRNTIKETVGK